MGRRSRRRASGEVSAESPTTDYPDSDGNVLALRRDVPANVLTRLDALAERPAASGEDRWQRRTEFLFERLAVRWTIAGLPIERQKELLGRYRMADQGTRAWVRQTIDRHIDSRVE